jgi:epoxyqueuosine reductase
MDFEGRKSKMGLEEEVRKVIRRDEGFLVGFADLCAVIGHRYGSHRYAIVLAKKLDDRIIDSIIYGPTEDYYRLYRETNGLLLRMLSWISEELSSLHVSCLSIKPTVNDEELDVEYLRTLRTDFSHKMAATRAGMGWIGKTDLLVTEEFGPRVRLGTLLIDRPVGEDAIPVDESRCGSCTLCVKMCPASAASGLLWKVGMEREDFFDPFKCRNTCIDLSLKNLKKRVSICGICVSVCPKGVKRTAGTG